MYDIFAAIRNTFEFCCLTITRALHCIHCVYECSREVIYVELSAAPSFYVDSQNLFWNSDSAGVVYSVLSATFRTFS